MVYSSLVHNQVALTVHLHASMAYVSVSNHSMFLFFSCPSFTEPGEGRWDAWPKSLRSTRSAELGNSKSCNAWDLQKGDLN